MFAPEQLYPTERPTNEAVLPALRELLSQSPEMMGIGVETLSERLYTLRYLPFPPDVADVQAARKALLVEGEVLA
jgi:hypothetical protein